MGDGRGADAFSDRVTNRLITIEAIEQAQSMMASEPDPDAILEILAGSTARIIDAETLAITLLSDDRRSVRYACARGKHAGTLDGMVLDVANAGLCGWVLENRKPILSVNLLEDPRIIREAAVSLGIHTALLSPLVARGEIVGGLSAFNKKDGSKFNEDDLAALSQLCSYAALAVVNARLTADLVREKTKAETILGSIREGLLFITCDGVIAEANRAAYELSGTGLDSLAGVNIVDIDASDPIHDVLGWAAQAAPGESCWERLSCEELSCPAHGARTLRCWTRSSGHCPTAGWGEPGGEKLWERCRECANMKSACEHLGRPREVEAAGRTLKVSSTQVMRRGTDCISGELVAMHDITAEKRLDLQKSEFISMLSHDLKGPLTSIKGYTELINQENEISAIRELSGVITSNTGQMLKLVNQMLEYFRVESGNLEADCMRIDPGALIGLIVERYGPSARDKGVVLGGEVAAGTREAFADIDMLTRITGNLVMNALDSVRPGGSIKISVSNGPEGFVAIEVHDDGQGIEPEHLPMIFEKYYSRGKGGPRAGGLGLYIVKALCELQGGTVDVESSQGGGATFRVVLPAVSPPKEASAPS